MKSGMYFTSGPVWKCANGVSIRPLQTTDLRVRRISGRHQISADGKHLIDGIAFGRPFLRKAGRPTLRIPPRKQRRVTYDGPDYVDNIEGGGDGQLVIRNGLNNGYGPMAQEDSDDLSELFPTDEYEEDWDAELEGLQDDMQVGAKEGANIAADNDGAGALRNSTRRSRTSATGLGLLQLLDENGRPFVGEYHNPLLDEFEQDVLPSSRPTNKRRNRSATSLQQGALKGARRGYDNDSANLASMSGQKSISRRNSACSNKSVRFDDAESATPATILESQGSDEEDDEDFAPDDVDESDKENAEPVLNDTGSIDVISSTLPDM